MPDTGGGGLSQQSILDTYRALVGLSPLISAAIQGGFGTDEFQPSKTPSVLQSMVAQDIANPKGPIKVSMADLMNPNLLGLGYPKVRGGAALPAFGAGLSALGAAPSIANLARALGLFGGGFGQQPGGQAPQPTVGAGQVPQVNLGGVTTDQFPVEQPVNMSPFDQAGGGYAIPPGSPNYINPDIGFDTGSDVSGAIYGYY